MYKLNMALIDMILETLEGESEIYVERKNPILQRIGRYASNMRTAVFIDNGEWVTVMYSYETPVAIKIDNTAFQSDETWSNTTTRHISKWCGLNVPKISQEELNRFNPWEYMEN